MFLLPYHLPNALTNPFFAQVRNARGLFLWPDFGQRTTRRSYLHVQNGQKNLFPSIWRVRLRPDQTERSQRKRPRKNAIACNGRSDADAPEPSVSNNRQSATACGFCRSCRACLFDGLDFLRSQPVKVIDQAVNLSVGGDNLPRDRGLVGGCSGGSLLRVQGKHAAHKFDYPITAERVFVVAVVNRPNGHLLHVLID